MSDYIQYSYGLVEALLLALHQWLSPAPQKSGFATNGVAL